MLHNAASEQDLLCLLTGKSNQQYSENIHQKPLKVPMDLSKSYGWTSTLVEKGLSYVETNSIIREKFYTETKTGKEYEANEH